jgi:hypothetical protein
MGNEEDFDIEKSYSNADAIAALQRLADTLEQRITFEIFTAINPRTG